MNAPNSEILDTHDFEDDSPHALSSVVRWTCRTCGRAVLVNGPVVYGSASQSVCEEAG